MKLLIKAKELYLEYSGKEVLDIEEVEVFDSQKIGIVGKNGSGKSSLIKVLLNEIKPDEGLVEVYGDFSYVSQLNPTVNTEDLGLMKHHEFEALDCDREGMSGGEITRSKISSALASYGHGLILDEPSSFLDREGIESLMNQLKYYPGAILLVSHDRYLLDEVVDTIWEIENGKLSVYDGNYSKYLDVKKLEEKQLERTYEAYLSKKKHLEDSALKIRNQAERISSKNKKNQRTNKTNDGGRLAMQKDVGTKEKKMMRLAKGLEKEARDLKETEYRTMRTKFKIRPGKVVELNNPFPISARNVSKQYDDKLIFEDVSFDIPLKSKVAIIGGNGSGKTTLFKMILNKEKGVNIASRVKIGYFKQDTYLDNLSMNVYEYMSKGSDYREAEIRSLLSNLSVHSADLTKTLDVLSGGEIMKLKLAKLFIGNYNVLLLDEPTNFLDLDSIKVIEDLMINYEGTILFTSHDRCLVERVSDYSLSIINKKIE